jgi:hypothetical protein
MPRPGIPVMYYKYDLTVQHLGSYAKPQTRTDEAFVYAKEPRDNPASSQFGWPEPGRHRSQASDAGPSRQIAFRRSARIGRPPNQIGQGMTDQAADAARAVAKTLALELGLPDLPVEVETVLAERDAPRRPDRYLDPISLASVIVPIAALAWTVYNDIRARHGKDGNGPAPQIEDNARDAVRDAVRTALDNARDAGVEMSPGDEEPVIECIVTEIVRLFQDPGD